MSEEKEFVPLSDREKFELQAKVSHEQFEIAKINLENAKTQLQIVKVSADSKKYEIDSKVADSLCFNRLQELAIFIYIILGLCVFNSVLTFFF